MHLLHLAIYSFMFGLGMIGGILFPDLPWLTMFLFGSLGVFMLRSHKARQASRLQIVLRHAEQQALETRSQMQDLFNSPTE
jgi:hypothetical protein